MSQELEAHPFDDPEEARRWVQGLDVSRVVFELSRIGRELEALSHEVALQDERVVRLDGEYRKAYATSFVTAAGPVKEREQLAVLDTEDERTEAELAKQVLRAMKERVKILRDRLEIGRSINAAVRTQFTTESIGQHT